MTARLRAMLSFIAIILLAFLLRLAAIDNAPLFGDEVAHLVRAHRIIQGELFAGLRHQKWLFSFVLAAFRPMGIEGMWIARTQSALSSTVTTAATIGLGSLVTHQWAGQRIAHRIGLLAGLLYAVMPLAVFHERQALVDSMLVMFTTVAAVLTVVYCKRPRNWLVGIIALTLAVAYLTKATAILTFTVPILAPLLLNNDPQQARRGMIVGGVAISLGLGLALLVNQVGVWTGIEIMQHHTPAAQNIALLYPFQSETWRTLHSNVSDVMVTLIGYIGFVPLAMILLVEIWLVAREASRSVLFLLIPSAVVVFVLIAARPVMSIQIVPPRYLLIALPFAVCLISLSTHILIRRLDVQQPAAKRVFWLVLVGQMTLPGLWFGAMAIHDPASIPLVDPDIEQYDWLYERDGTYPMAKALRKAWAESGAERIYVMGPGLYEMAIQAYLGPDTVTFASINQEDTRRAVLINWLSIGGPTFLFERQNRVDVIQGLNDVQVEQVGSYGYDDLALFRVVGAQDDLATQIHARLAGDPAFMEADYNTLAAALRDEAPPTQIAVFPSAHAATLAERVNRPVAPLAVETWPLTPAAVSDTLHQLETADLVERVDVVLVNEEASDADGMLRRALQQALYRTGEESWYGVLHRQQFITGPFDPALEPQAIIFENAIHLTASVVLDAEPQPDDAARFALRWQTDILVHDSFKMFVHLVDTSGNVLAQHDAIPGGGTLPMTSWTPGEAIDDHFAILIPNDAPSGRYELRLGLYDPASGLRLRVTNGEPGPDYAAIGHIDIQPR